MLKASGQSWSLGLFLFTLFSLLGISAKAWAQARTEEPAAPAVCAQPADAGPQAKLHPSLLRRLAEDGKPVKTWVFFTDKGIHSPEEYQAAVERVAATYNQRAKQRRSLRGTAARTGRPLFGEYDLPVVQEYVDAVATTGAKVHVTTRWLNGVSAWATRQQLDRIAALHFVRALQPVARSRRIDVMNVQELGDAPPSNRGSDDRLDYGNSEAQLNQINLIALHDEGFTGNGVIVGILDTGFHRTHEAFNNPENPLNVIAEYDFVDDDGNTDIESGDPYGQHNHGTMILGCLAAYMPGSLVGGAYSASFILCKTEDTTDEYPAEEDNYVAGLEFIEAHGADMTTSSLGYIDWYTQDDLDGQTAVTTIAVNISTSLGIHHCNAAGNGYHDSNPNTSSLIAPADAFQCLTCGAVDSSGNIAYFSSDGPTADGRVKPEVLARGISTHTVSPSSDTGYTTADGTSLSTPLVACAVASLIDARPYWTVDKMRENLFQTADYYVQYGTYDPLYVRGYGIIDALAAYQICPDAGVIELDRNEYACESTATIAVADCGLNLDDNLIDTVEVAIASDSEPAGETVTLYETDAASAQFEGSITLSATDSVGVLLVAEDDIVTVTYIDADDGQGGTNVEVTDLALVDCTPPTIWNIQVIDIEPRSATVTFDADETVRGTVQYGLACDDLTDAASGGYGNPASVGLTGLQDDTTYYFIVFAEDEAGNEVTDDNGGACYSFTTPEVPNFFTEQFSSGNDLDYLSLCFTPNGSVDYYAGCAEEITSLPTDPSGGTPLSISEDSYQQVSLGGGETVSLYGTSYSSFYVCDNGYITFTGSDTDYTESLEDHFDMPRISAVFDDFSVDNYDGFVSWKQEADRAVVTYENVPEYGTSNHNTFQVEMYFNGDITISYLALDAGDGLAGLSEGNGLDPDFYETDLSAMGSCGPRPPTAESDSVTMEVNIAVTVTLTASDDGLPEPPALDYIIVSLPANGTLSDPGAGIIDSVPYTLVGGGNLVQYDPDYIGPDSFTFKANDGGTPPEGGDSNVATIDIEVTPPVPHPVYDFLLDTDPGWSVEGQWAFGQPTGGGSHDGDPSSGHTGSNVYGYNLNGDYAVSMPAYYLTSTAIDCSNLLYVELRFWRWLGVESCNFDHATVEVSNDGSAWTVLWENPLTSISDISWSQMVFDLSAIADGEPTVYLRWSMGPTDPSVTYPGWNIDDIEIWATVAECPGDLDGDNDVDLADLAELLANYGTTSGAVYEDGDLDGDGDVDLADLAELLSLYGTTC